MTRLQDVRLKKCLTQRELATKANIPYNTIIKYESGARDISKANFNTLAKLANVLGCEIKELIN